MKLVAFTVVQHAVLHDYPLEEAVQAVSEACAEVWISVEKSSDGTLELIKSWNNPKLKICETSFSDNLPASDIESAQLKDILTKISLDATWLLYFRPDEVLHEDTVSQLDEALHLASKDIRVEALLMNFRHFWGSYEYVATSSRNIYRKEVRIMRNLEGLEPWNKGHSFRLKGRKLKTLNSNTWMHDYGWVNLNRYSSEEIKKHLQESQCHIAHLGHDELDAVIKFAGRHPQVMQNRIRAVNWNYSPPTELKSDWKDRLRMSLELLLGRRIGQNRNYIKL